MILRMLRPTLVAVDFGYNTFNVVPRGHAHVKVYKAQNCHKMSGIIAYGGNAEAQACKMIKHPERYIAIPKPAITRL